MKPKNTKVNAERFETNKKDIIKQLGELKFGDAFMFVSHSKDGTSIIVATSLEQMSYLAAVTQALAIKRMNDHIGME